MFPDYRGSRSEKSAIDRDIEEMERRQALERATKARASLIWRRSLLVTWLCLQGIGILLVGGVTNGSDTLNMMGAATIFAALLTWAAIVLLCIKWMVIEG